MHEFSKSHKSRLRHLAARLNELEVKESLAPLSRKFDDWKSGKITSLELSELLHEYDYRDSRRLWSRYQTKRQDSLVALGYVRGHLSETDIGPDLLMELQNLIQFYRDEPE